MRPKSLFYGPSLSGFSTIRAFTALLTGSSLRDVKCIAEMTPFIAGTPTAVVYHGVLHTQTCIQKNTPACQAQTKAMP